MKIVLVFRCFLLLAVVAVAPVSVLKRTDWM